MLTYIVDNYRLHKPCLRHESLANSCPPDNSVLLCLRARAFLRKLFILIFMFAVTGLRILLCFNYGRIKKKKEKIVQGNEAFKHSLLFSCSLSRPLYFLFPGPRKSHHEQL